MAYPGAIHGVATFAFVLEDPWTRTLQNREEARPVTLSDMGQKWIGIGHGHGGRAAEQALSAEGFKCARSGLLNNTELKVLVREDTADREHLEQILSRVNGKEAWISPVSGTPTHSFPGYREEV